MAGCEKTWLICTRNEIYFIAGYVAMYTHALSTHTNKTAIST